MRVVTRRVSSAMMAEMGGMCGSIASVPFGSCVLIFRCFCLKPWKVGDCLMGDGSQSFKKNAISTVF